MHFTRFRSSVALGIGLAFASPAFAAGPVPVPAPAVPAAEAQPPATDATITAGIKARFDQVKLLRAAPISIATYEGVVTLSGSVPSDFARERALEVARATPGVVRVDDYLRLDISSPEAPSKN
jgi:hypothetical protein